MIKLMVIKYVWPICHRDIAYVKINTLDREFWTVISADNAFTFCLDKCLGRGNVSSETWTERNIRGYNSDWGTLKADTLNVSKHMVMYPKMIF